MQVLIADDDRFSLHILSRRLTGLGHQVTSVEDGNSALSTLQMQHFDIAIIDWMMPGIDGPTLCRQIRQTSGDRYLYVILLTAKDSKSDIVAGLDSGADDYLTKPFSVDELAARLRSGERILQLHESLIEARERLRLMATRDSLTGLLNRRALFDEARAAAQKASGTGRLLAVFLCDVDHFKRLNDTFGHPAGDAALSEIAERISSSLGNGQIIGRYGGEEFMVVMPETSYEIAMESAERVRKSVCGTPFTHVEHRIQVSMSIGAAISSIENPAQLDAILNDADACLLQAKRQGRNQVVWNSMKLDDSGRRHG